MLREVLLFAGPKQQEKVKAMVRLGFVALALSVYLVVGFHRPGRSSVGRSSSSTSEARRRSASSRSALQMALNVMVNGMPGPMALEVAQACLDRGFNLVPVGFTGLNQPASIQVVGATRTVDVQLQAGPGLGPDAAATMKAMKAQYPDLVVVDYTHPSAIMNNLACYVDHNCEFVMGTTGGDPALMKAAFDKGTNLAVIAPNMGKQIVALQAALQEMAKRFPGSFAGYKLTVRGGWLALLSWGYNKIV